ncbi:MAG: class F sortase [Actinomycetia bacterium]|nr:class F sortase [Actinomycetes bacterium]
MSGQGDYPSGMPDDGDLLPLTPVDDDPPPPPPARPVKRKRRIVDTLLLLLAVLLLLGGATAGYVAYRQHADVMTESRGTVDLEGNPVIPDDPEVFESSYQSAASAVPEITPTPGKPGLRFKVPSQGMNVSLGAVNEVNGSINPPGYTSAYWVRNRGVGLDKAASGTVYIAMHSVRANYGKAPGNFLIDVPNQTTSLHRGDEILVGDLTYVMTESRNIDKPELAAQADIWDDTPGELIIITCLQNREHTPSTMNLVIFATLVQ